MPLKRWEIPAVDRETAGILAEECGISRLAASVLLSRGHATYRDAARFLGDGAELASPFELIDMEKAVERIRRAVDDYERITVYGDYDCDGITATVVLYSYLSSMGADVSYYIPERDGEGYGLNCEAVERLAGQGTRLLITVDNGISALSEIHLANSLGMDVIVTDHHQPPEELPAAYAVVDPHRRDCPSRFKELAGVGVAFKVVAALEGGDCESALEYVSDLVALGTVGDVVPLVEENRTIVHSGLQALAVSDNLGLRALMETAGVKPDALTAQTLAFSLVPRINAAGRMGEAGLAARLLLSEDEEEAARLASQLDGRNRQRQEQETAIIAQVEDMLSADRTLLNGRVLIVRNDHWNHGILGIACSKLVERYGKPVLLLTRDTGDPGLYKGSARSLGEFHMFKALAANAACLTQYGGHKAAAGFSIREEQYAAFVQGMEAYAREYHEFMPPMSLHVDQVLEEQALTVEEIDSLSVLEPFGAGNEPPLFCLRDALLESVTPLSGDRHQKLLLRIGGRPVAALWFGVTAAQLPCHAGERLDLLVQAGINSYNGSRTVSLKIRDVRPAGFDQETFFRAKGYYEKIRRGEPVSAAVWKRAAPTREEAGTVYRLLRQQGGHNGDSDSLYIRMQDGGTGCDINYCKLRILLDILEEAELIGISPAGGIRLLPVSGKADLTKTPSWKRVWKV